MNKKEKGFTLVELLVVIAIVAILATVSVVGYLSFTDKAKLSNDKVLVKQANTLLQGDETVNAKRSTMYDTVLYLKNNGILIETLQTEEKGNFVVWNQENNRFYIFNSDNKPVYPESETVVFNNLTTWKIVDKYDENCNFSQYIKDLEFKDTVINNVDTGLDVGFNTEFTNIKYSNLTNNAQTVNLRTNGGELIIDGPKDTVNHYGSSTVCDVQNVDPNNSYHKFAETGILKVKNGHIVIEKEFKDKPIITITSGANDIVSIDANVDANVTLQEGSVVDNVTIKTTTTSKVSVDNKLAAKVTGNKEEFVIDKVGDFASLQAALKDHTKNYIQLTADIVATELTETTALTINRSLTLDGNGYSINSINKVPQYARLLNIMNLNNDRVILKNINLNMLDENSSYDQTVFIKANINSSIIINYCNISTLNYYAVNIGTLNDNLIMDLDNGNVSAGWAAIYNHSSGVKLNAKNSKFIGINKYSNHQSNSFSTIVVAEYYQFNPKVGLSNNNLFVFDNCEIEARLVTPNDIVQQHLIDVRSPMNNKCYLNNCKMITNSGDYRTCLYSNYDGNRSDEAFDGTSQIIINGKLHESGYYIDQN